ncbi:phosphoribosylanthranilate isomerase [Granulicella sibirica]|uniref:N-(5'-phosphoribosyl)anthranilate isomerase n=1 Tax=Granulicella sibirica TaxID=2479048 RepID=A0A4Q0TAL6_9BACT|nr:phosphoribosylanthranilate isomerase [Granulicella sibirica]RXH58691.1 Phosphoribosylanthranilate isomerase [Granulicella sibirica]
MWVKICGNTSLKDAQAAVDLGADAIGFVFAPSSRQMTPEAVRVITERLTGKPECFGVFQTMNFAEIRDAVRTAGLTGVQLHGGVSIDLIAALRKEFSPSLSITQTLHWDINGSPEAANQLSRLVHDLRETGQVNRILIDSKVGKALGGTGRTFDWNAAQQLFRDAGEIEMIAAGGLNPENVGEAVQRLRPFGVDVSSGVESEPGRKDPERLRLFIERARAAGENPAS